MVMNPLFGLAMLALFFGASFLIASTMQGRVSIRKSVLRLSALCVLVGVIFLLASQTV